MVRPGHNADTAGTAYTFTTMMSDDRYNTFIGGELVFTKRLSNKWMANVAFTLQTQKSYYGDNDYPESHQPVGHRGQQYGFTFGGASGKIDRDYFSRWTVQVSGLYQLPWDINISGDPRCPRRHVLSDVLHDRGPDPDRRPRLVGQPCRPRR